jgi:tetratricopeptide (TPR) repeat protein
MKMTIEQALHRAVEAHKAGKLQEAEALYRVILQNQPKHPDANHNLGVMAVSVNKAETALTFFKIAIESNPNQGQFWLSYLDALIKEKQFDNARNVLDLAKKRGLVGEKVEVYEEKLKLIFLTQNSESSSKNTTPTVAHQQKKASTKKEKKKSSKRNLINLNRRRSPPKIELNNLLELYNKGQYELAQNLAITLTKQYPNDPFGWKVLGVLFQKIGKLRESMVVSQKVLEISPNDAEAHSNFGNILQELGNLEDAEASYNKAIAIKPDYAEAYYNLGITLKGLGRLEDAETSTKKAILIKPEHAESHIHLSYVLKELGRLEESEKSLNQIIKIKSNPIFQEKTASVTALLPFGRSGSLFLHSLFDGHPEIATVPGIYLKGWFGLYSWEQLASDMNRSDWRELLVARFVESHLPLFDAGNKNNVPGQPLGEAKWLSKSLGFMEMGNDRTRSFVVDKNAFATIFINSLKTLESIDTRGCFELIHRAFEIAIRGNEGTGSNPNGPIFYHIHNPNLFERSHFLQHYPQAKMFHLMRNPVQSLESWLLQIDEGYGHFNYIYSKFKYMDQLKNWSSAVERIVSMFAKLQMPDHRLPGSFGVKIEDVKHNPRKTMPQLAARLGISNHPALYESSFCGLQYWGPSSKAVGKITGFDTTAIDQPIGRLFGPKDVVIFETLFWPLSRLYSYSDLDLKGFRHQLKEIRPWLDEPLEFENKLYSSLPNKTCNLKDLPQYRRLHHLLHLFWNVLDREGTYQDMVQPLKLE